MYEDDRLHALKLYDDIFEEVGDENAVLNMLVSPTRQAVNLARAYDARERRFQDDDGQGPAYEQVIEDLRSQAATLIPAEPRYSPVQTSIFNEEKEPEADENLFDSFGFHELPPPESNSGRHEAEPQEISLFPDEDRDSGAYAPPPPQAVKAQEPAEDAPSEDVESFSDAVDKFLAEFNIGELVPEKEAAAPVKTQEAADAAWRPVEPPAQPQREEFVWQMPDEDPAPVPAPVQEPAAPAPEPPREARPAKPAYTEMPDITAKPKKERSVGIMILGILFAFPVGVCAVAVLLAAAVVLLGFAAVTLGAGFGGLASAFSFSVFADILLVFGVSLGCAAIGLLLFWVFIWLLFGAIPGTVRGLCNLVHNISMREVSA